MLSLAERMVRDQPSSPVAYANLMLAKSRPLMLTMAASDVTSLSELEALLEEGNQYLARFPGDYSIRQQLWPIMVQVGLQRSLLFDASALELLNAAMADGDEEPNRPPVTRAGFRSHSLPLAYRAVCHAVVFGDAAAARDDYRRAISLMEEVLNGEPDDPMSARRLAHVLGAAALAEAELAKQGVAAVGGPEDSAESLAQRAAHTLDRLVKRGLITRTQAAVDGDLALRALRENAAVASAGSDPLPSPQD
jgi:hypothetical protein